MTNSKERKCYKCQKPITTGSRSGLCKKRSHTGNTYNWKGDDAGYNSKHDWVRFHYGRAYRCENKNCPKTFTNFQWSNIDHKYKRRRKDWIMLCVSCHKKKDKGMFCKRNHPLWGRNLIRVKKHPTKRACRACQKIYSDKWKEKNS